MPTRSDKRHERIEEMLYSDLEWEQSSGRQLIGEAVARELALFRRSMLHDERCCVPPLLAVYETLNGLRTYGVIYPRLGLVYFACIIDAAIRRVLADRVPGLRAKPEVVRFAQRLREGLMPVRQAWLALSNPSASELASRVNNNARLHLARHPIAGGPDDLLDLRDDLLEAAETALSDPELWLWQKLPQPSRDEAVSEIHWVFRKLDDYRLRKVDGKRLEPEAGPDRPCKWLTGDGFNLVDQIGKDYGIALATTDRMKGLESPRRNVRRPDRGSRFADKFWAKNEQAVQRQALGRSRAKSLVNPF